MLYRLEAENFFSIRDHQVLDLTIAPNVPDLDNRFAPIFPGSELRAPKVVALFGANASGKTNVLRALEFVVSLIRDSVSRVYQGFPCERFNDQESSLRPIRLALEFGGVINLSQEVNARMSAGETPEFGVYRYEVELEVRDGAPFRIHSEALRQRPNGAGKWQRVFERDAQGKVKDSRSFSLTGFQHLLNTLQPHVSVLSSFALFQHPTAMLFIEMAKTVIFQIGAPATIAERPILNYIDSQPDLLARLNTEIRRIDVGIEAMRFVPTANGPEPMFMHSGLEVEMPWVLESHGTQAFIKIFPALEMALDKGSLVAVDELDVSIHSVVLPEIVRWFYDGDRNSENAQLWFSCHSVSLLDDLVKEEIVICEKDRGGRTKFHSLMDVKVRRDENHYRKYLGGAYGGIPVLG